ncbi:MAG: type II toxin-antitoxin system VapC family toxin [Terracidiphilus sp.]
MSVFVDSDILIEILRARDQQILSVWESLGKNEMVLLYSPISAAEVWAGARPNEHGRTIRLLRPMLCTPIDYETGRLAGEFLLQFSKSHNLKIGDALIAAGAILHQASLWTRNLKHYPMPQLTLFS